MSDPPTPPKPARCPRCGYDVSGAIPTWTSHCPLESTCSECGMEFRWSRLLGPTGYAPPWLFEYATRRRLRSIGVTALRTWAPWKFWSDMPIELPVRPRRLAFFAAAWSALFYVAVGLIVGLVDLQWGSGFLYNDINWRLAHLPIADPLLIGALWPLLFADEWTSSALLGGHGTYLTLLIVWLCFIPLTFAPISQSLRAARARWVHLARIEAYAAGGLIAFFWYGWLVPALPFLIWTAGASGGVVSWPPQWIEETALPILAVATPVLAAAWLVLFWCFAISRYLRLPHPRAVAALLLLASLLGALAVLAYWPWSGLVEHVGGICYFLEGG